MAELRRDPVVGRWVIINTDDSMAPESFEKENQIFKQESICQFCYGKENQTPPEIEAIRPNGSQPNTPGWNLRVVPNKFPALRLEGDLNKRGIGIFDVMSGIGAHEVLIETPEHRKDLADLSMEEILNVIRKYRSRSLGLAQDKRLKYVLIFKNHGESAGASLEHTHTQIIALPMVPKYVLEEMEGAQEYFNQRGRCIFCDMIKQEYQDKERIVSENEHFLSFCPYAPRYAFESWIIPKRHNPQFTEMSDDEERALAALLREMLLRMKKCLVNPSYNFFLHTGPVNYPHQEGYHWHIEIIPKLTRVAGFEWGTGFYIVPTAPHLAAKYLKETKI